MNEGFEEPPEDPPMKQQLGVELHADAEVAVAPLDRLRQAVLLAGAHRQAFAEAVDGLAVDRVHPEPLAAQDRVQPRAGGDRHLLAEMDLPQPVLRIGRGMEPLGHVHVQGAAGGDVHQLGPAADAEGRQVFGQRSLEEGELHLLARMVVAVVGLRAGLEAAWKDV